MPHTVLIVEDEAELAGIIADYVAAEGWRATVVGDGSAALAEVRRHAPDLLVLDLLLPGLDGLAVCEAVRRFSDVPIIMVTAKVEEIDRLLGLDAGADDYLCKPFSPRELIARARAVLRRRREPGGVGLLHVDDTQRTIRLGTAALDLTATEFDLLSALVRRPGTIFSRAQLLELIRPETLDVNDRIVDTHVKNLRRKLAAVLPETPLIHAVYGLGYRFEH